MDPIVQRYDAMNFTSDLMITRSGGIAYQKDMTKSVPYDNTYFQRYIDMENTPISSRINDCRKKMVKGISGHVLDIGIGSGEFMKTCGKRCYGYDVNEVAVEWLISQNSFMDPYNGVHGTIDVITLWDVMEHMRRPSDLLLSLRFGMHVMVSLPTFPDLKSVVASKHYRPNEHWYYFTVDGIKKFFFDMGYECLDVNDSETVAGRESIMSYHFYRIKEIKIEDVLSPTKLEPIQAKLEPIQAKPEPIQVSKLEVTGSTGPKPFSPPKMASSTIIAPPKK